MNDTLTTKKIRIELPGGAIESDSGSHLLDVLTVIVLIGVLYVGKKFVDRLFNKIKKGKE